MAPCRLQCRSQRSSCDQPRRCQEVATFSRERVLAHLRDRHDSEKTQTLRAINAPGLKPRLEILSHDIHDEETALRVEAAAIDLPGLGARTSQCRGWKSLELGRMTLSQLEGYYAVALKLGAGHPAPTGGRLRLQQTRMVARVSDQIPNDDRFCVAQIRSRICSCQHVCELSILLELIANKVKRGHKSGNSHELDKRLPVRALHGTLPKVRSHDD